MRHPRLNQGARLNQRARLTPLVAVAHGSRDPRAAATVTELLSAVRARAARRGLGGLEVRAAFLDHCAPSLPQVLGSMPADGGPAVVVPLLLTAAYHSKADIPARLAAAAAARPGLDVVSAGTLGPDALLLAALERRLLEAGVAVGDAGEADSAATSVVLAAAGSSDPAANATIAELAARWARERGWRAVVPAYASAAGPRPGEAVRALREGGAARVAVATYLLAPGYFADKVREAALGAGAAAVSGVLGAAPEVADVVLDRYLAATAGTAGRDGDGSATAAGPAPAQARALAPDRLWPQPSYPLRKDVVAQLGIRSMRGNRRGTDAGTHAAPP